MISQNGAEWRRTAQNLAPSCDVLAPSCDVLPNEISAGKFWIFVTLTNICDVLPCSKIYMYLKRRPATSRHFDISRKISEYSWHFQIFTTPVADICHWPMEQMQGCILRRFVRHFLRCFKNKKILQQFFLDTLSQSLSHLELCHSEQRLRSDLKPGRKVFMCDVLRRWSTIYNMRRPATLK